MTLTQSDIFYRENTCENENIQLLHVGCLVFDKAQHILLKAFADLVSKNSNITLTIVGSGPKGDSLKKLAKSLGVCDLIDFKGFIESESELYEIYKRSDAFLLTSISEGFPRVFYEAMAHGLPIVSTVCGGIGHLLRHRETAMLSAVNDVVAFSDNVSELMTNAELRKKLISNSYELLDKVLKNNDPSQISKLICEYSQ